MVPTLVLRSWSFAAPVPAPAGAAVANAKTTVAINNTTPRLQAHTAPQRCQLTVARVNPSGLIQSVLIQYGAGVAPAPEGI